MRTGVSCEGKEVLAVCWDDIPKLLHSPILIQKKIKDAKIGKHNIPKDFVPAGSPDPAIKRAVNSRSRKCTVIWLDKLPHTLQERIQLCNHKAIHKHIISNGTMSL